MVNIKQINIKFCNFWPQFDEPHFFDQWRNIYTHKNILWTNDPTKPYDVIISSVFGDITILDHTIVKKYYTRRKT